jgi:hypothetical protein
MPRTATSDREARLRRSLCAGWATTSSMPERAGTSTSTGEGPKVNEGRAMFGLDLAGVEAWIKERAKPWDLP